MEHKHIQSSCLGGCQYAYCHACKRQRCRNCGAEVVPQHNHPVTPANPYRPTVYGPHAWPYNPVYYFPGITHDTYS